MSLSAGVNELLTTLETITPSQLASVLQEIGPHLGRDDWSAILYTIEELATTGQADRALDLMEVCMQHAHLAQNAWSIRATTYFLGHVYRHRGEVEQAVASYHLVAEAGVAAGDKDGKEQASLALGDISRARMAQGRVSEAIAVIQEALILNEKLGWHTAEIGDRLTLANLYLAQEDFDRAETIALEALNRARALDDTFLIAVAWSGLAEIQADLHNNLTALESYQTTLDVLEAIEDPADLELWLRVQQEALAGLGMVHQEMGQLEQAITYYAEAARTAYDLDNKREQAAIITWLGTAQLDAGRPEQALRSFRAALRLSDSAGDTWWMGTIHFYRASALRALGRLDEAKEVVRLSMQVHAAVPGQHSVDEAACLIELGEIALEQGQVNQAVARYQQALQALANVDVGSVERLIYAKLGEAYWHMRDLSRAYDILHRALSIYESKRRTVSSLMARIDFAPSREGVYTYLAKTCLALGKAEEALQIVEEGRARVLREQLAQRAAKLDLDEVLDWQQVKSLLQ